MAASSLPFELHHDFAHRLPSMVSAARGEDQPTARLIMLNEELAAQLGLDPEWLRTEQGLEFLLGRGPDTPHAMAYAGFQFGNYNPSMGDGRALLLGEVTGPTTPQNPTGLWDLHAKGTGLTPYSRYGSDGRGTLRSMLREYLFSEAMHALGIPSTRSLAVLATGRPIQRQRVEEAGVLVRVASSHIRVGSFHFAAHSEQPGLLAQLAEYTIERHYPGANPRELFTQVMDAQAATVAGWMQLGFIHGVMNTDNTTLSGETIDYGPCAFMEDYDPDTCFSSIDTQGRYRYGNQPDMVGWNLARLAESLLPLLDASPTTALTWAQETINSFGERYSHARKDEAARRLQLPEELYADYATALEQSRPDLTQANRALVAAASGDRAQAYELFGTEEFLDAYCASSPNPTVLETSTPRVVPRPRLVEAALADVTEFSRFLQAATHPFDAAEEYEKPGGTEGYLTFCGT
ncbi:protein adenylyltransferase SelO family protein [Corynebacterium singulare]|nr:protein adenylyltransferase SelO family protein [Corynebacterium singulare]